LAVSVFSAAKPAVMALVSGVRCRSTVFSRLSDCSSANQGAAGDRPVMELGRDQGWSLTYNNLSLQACSGQQQQLLHLLIQPLVHLRTGWAAWK
jgi:hypothetical protein